MASSVTSTHPVSPLAVPSETKVKAPALNSALSSLSVARVRTKGAPPLPTVVTE
jgi:hypothetical protein